MFKYLNSIITMMATDNMVTVIVGVIIFIIFILGLLLPFLSGLITTFAGGQIYYEDWHGTGGVDTSLSHPVTQVLELNNLSVSTASNTNAAPIGGCHQLTIPNPSQNGWTANVTVNHLAMPDNSTTIKVNGHLVGFLTTGTTDTYSFSGTFLVNGNNLVCYGV